MNLLPPLTDMVRPDEYTLSIDEELRLLDDRRKRTRWWSAPPGTLVPGPRTEPTTSGFDALVDPWLAPWEPLNDPDADPMVGACVLDRSDPGQGLLIWVHPTDEARLAWEGARNLPRAFRQPEPVGIMLGCETAIRVPRPQVDYRAVFRWVIPLSKIHADADQVRWAFARPPGQPTAWDVMTGGWLPERHKRFPRPPAGEIES